MRIVRCYSHFRPENDVFTRLIKTAIKTVLRSDNKPIYGYNNKITASSSTTTIISISNSSGNSS